jgi:hypothetical protein
MRLIRGPSSFLGCADSAIFILRKRSRGAARRDPLGGRVDLTRTRVVHRVPRETLFAHVWPCRCRRNRVFMNAVRHAELR